MNKRLFGFAAALVALLVLSVAVFSGFHFGVPPLLKGLTLVAILFGTATVTYTWPVTGTTPPTAAQMQNADSVRATLLMGDTDTTATMTTNFGTTTTQLAALFPDVVFYPVTLTSVSETSPPIISVTLTANAVTFTKVSAAGSGGLWNAKAARPHTIGQ